MKWKLFCLAGVAAAMALNTGCAGPATATEAPIVSDVALRLAKFSPTPLEADLSALSAEDRKVLGLLVQAAGQMNEIFLRQAWAGNPALREEMKSWTGKDAARDYYNLNFGPWDRLDAFKPFLGTKAHPEGAGFYPEDMTKQEFESWVEEAPGRPRRLPLRHHRDPPRRRRP